MAWCLGMVFIHLVFKISILLRFSQVTLFLILYEKTQK